MAVEPSAEASTDADRDLKRPLTAQEIGARIDELHRAFRDVTIEGDNLKARVDQMQEQLNDLDRRRRDIIDELLGLSTPPGGKSMLSWVRR